MSQSCPHYCLEIGQFPRSHAMFPCCSRLAATEEWINHYSSCKSYAWNFMSFSIGTMASLTSSSPTNTLTFITYLNYLSVRVLAQNIWYLKLGNLGGVVEGILVEGCVGEPTDRCYDFHQGNKYPNLRLLPFDFFPVSHWPDPTGSQRSREPVDEVHNMSAPRS